MSTPRVKYARDHLSDGPRALSMDVRPMARRSPDGALVVPPARKASRDTVRVSASRPIPKARPGA